MSRPTISQLTLAAALLGAAASPAAAQSAPIAASRQIASYRLAAGANSALPTEVTVADSAGALVASYRLAGGSAAQPMLVIVLDTDLVLQGETPAGVLTLRLRDENGAEPHPVRGEWWLGEQLAGQLRGRSPR